MANVSRINGYDIKDATARAKTDGHVVTDGTTDYTQRAKLKFIGATITDDSANGQTIVETEATPIATTSVAGKVIPDGTTITVDNDGTIHGTATVPIATTSVAGKVKPDGDSITVDANGGIAANCISTTTTDPGEGSALATGKLLVVLEAE